MICLIVVRDIDVIALHRLMIGSGIRSRRRRSN